jgi:psp operon transcriptional activator
VLASFGDSRHGLVDSTMSDSRNPFGKTRGGRDRLPETLGESEAIIDFQERLSAVAKVDRPVLIVGERGTGKELAVNRLHYLSARWQGPLVALNCSSLSPSVVESELFGHESGAFTGAMKRRAGRFEAADTGTLFLDEVGLIPMEVQEKILRVVEYRQFERVGGSAPIDVDVRIVGATNANLPLLAAHNKFKRDLLDRLSFEVLFLPPLRERGGDIVLLAQHFATRMSMELGRGGIPEFTDGAGARLESYRWPGNIRELKNVVERAVYKSPDALIEENEIVFDPFVYPYGDEALSDLPSVGESKVTAPPLPTPSGTVRAGSASAEVSTTVAETRTVTTKIDFKTFDFNEEVRVFEVNALRQAMQEAKFHQGTAAKLLGLSYHQVRGLFRKYKDEVSE